MPTIPPPLLKRIVAFCMRKATGQIVLHIHLGQIVAYTFTESGKVCNLDPTALILEGRVLTVEEIEAEWR